MATQAEIWIKKKIEEQKAGNPMGYKCTSCFKFGRFNAFDGCGCVNPNYFCSNHSQMKKEMADANDKDKQTEA